MLMPNPSDFRPAYKNQVNSHHPYKEASQLITTLKAGDFWPAHKNEVSFDPSTKTKKFRPAHKNEANFDFRPKKQVNFYPHTTTKSISIPHTKTDLISIPSLESSQL